MAQEQAELTAGRTYRIATATHGSAPTNGTTEPDFVLGPLAPGNIPTMGFQIGLTAPAAGSATAGAGGFTVTVYWRDPVLKRYQSFSSASISYGQAFGTFDIGPCELYIQFGNVSAAGDVDVTIAEQ